MAVRETWKSPETNLVSVVVPFVEERHVRRCLTRLREQSYRPLEVIAVADGTPVSSLDLPRRFPEVDFVHLSENRGFCVAANTGIHRARGEFVGLLNDDAEPDPHWIEQLVDTMRASPEVGACASKVLTRDAPPRIESAGDTYRPWRSPRARGAGRPADSLDLPAAVFGASAAAALYRRDALEEVGVFDEDLQSYYEDIDLAFRLRLAGHEIRYVPGALVRHVGHGSYDDDVVLHRVLRNDPLVYVKDMPGSLFWVFLPFLLVRQIYQLGYFALRGQLASCLRAKAGALALLPRFLAKRRAVEAIRTVPSRRAIRFLLL